jgi:PTS system nitrogen regulatory IIA component
MRITDFVAPAAVLHRLGSTTRPEVIEELARGLSAAYPPLAAPRILAALVERERLGTTGIGNGVAVPHGKLSGTDAVVGMVALAGSGVDVGAPDGRPARVFVAVLSPPRNPTAHLEAMAAIGRDLGNAALRKRLLAAANADEIYGILADAAFIAGD